MAKTVAVMLGQGFEPAEVVVPVDILRRGGVEVTLVSVMNNREVKSAQDIMMNADVLLDDTNLDDFDMIMIPGGSEGVENLEKSAILAEALRDFMAADRPVASICAGPTVLAGLGLLKNHDATCYPTLRDELGDSYVEKRVVKDKNLITSQGPGTAFDFGLAVLEFLMGESVADEVAQGMLLKS